MSLLSVHPRQVLLEVDQGPAGQVQVQVQVDLEKFKNGQCIVKYFVSNYLEI